MGKFKITSKHLDIYLSGDRWNVYMMALRLGLINPLLERVN